MGLLDNLIAAATERSLKKTSSPTPNVANLIAAHIRKVAPKLADVEGLWFSGSNVWRWLYAGDPPDPEADIDCFFLRQPLEVRLEHPFHDQRVDLLKKLGVEAGDARWPSVKTGRNKDQYAQGCHFLLDGRKVDVWEGHETAADTLNVYPTDSHSHCRAAFSFTEGLVVLPNEAACATPGSAGVTTATGGA